ncbi:dynein beta chain, ciliary-like [Drosophila sechellia]|uniref:dynein beta chain, ciliary-like n=1 Tax=Drosophila sechellia TaxID=7238 RepID=UPI0013DE6038|nr:dynein beta chain, ciliary-like [Drosophila sechellia]
MYQGLVHRNRVQKGSLDRFSWQNDLFLRAVASVWPGERRPRPRIDSVPDDSFMGRHQGPYIIVAFQECERMNNLMTELRRSLNELDLGFKGELTISSGMEDLMVCLYMDQVPEQWTKLTYPSMLGPQSCFSDLMLRLRELEGWVADFRMPSSIWLAGFFNPQSLLTAIMQQTSLKNEWPLDRMCLNCDVTKKWKEELT